MIIDENINWVQNKIFKKKLKMAIFLGSDLDLRAYNQLRKSTVTQNAAKSIEFAPPEGFRRKP
jgi:hypothetical protein